MNKIISIDDQNKKPGFIDYFISSIGLSVQDLEIWIDLFDNDENINQD